MRYIATMKTASISSVRVQPALREQVQAALREHESLSEFVESAIRQAVQQRRHQAEFIARGLRSLEQARANDDYVDADTVVRQLEDKLASARRTAKARRAAGP